VASSYLDPQHFSRRVNPWRIVQLYKTMMLKEKDDTLGRRQSAGAVDKQKSYMKVYPDSQDSEFIEATEHKLVEPSWPDDKIKQGVIDLQQL